MPTTTEPVRKVSVIIPARNEASRIGRVIDAVRAESGHVSQVEILVADDGSTDGTGAAAVNAGASVVSTGKSGGNPAAARNHAAREAAGDMLIFLDADCLPESGWLAAHLAAQNDGHKIVGGALSLPPGLSWTARCDYYASAYHVHPARRAGPVPSHTPANLSVARNLFLSTRGFVEQFPVADGHEELAWQAEARDHGVEPYFEPRAVAAHYNRSGLGNLVRRSYRWGYSALEAKRTSGAARGSVLYRFPLLAIVLAAPRSVLEAGYIAGQWLLAGKPGTIQFVPVFLLSRLVYAAGFIVGGLKWILRGPRPEGARPRWR